MAELMTLAEFEEKLHFIVVKAYGNPAYGDQDEQDARVRATEMQLLAAFRLAHGQPQDKEIRNK